MLQLSYVASSSWCQVVQAVILDTFQNVKTFPNDSKTRKSSLRRNGARIRMVAPAVSSKQSMMHSTPFRLLLIVVVVCLVSISFRWGFLDNNQVPPATIVITTFKQNLSASTTIIDFPGVATAIPRSEWPKLDNQTCLPEGLPEYPPDGSVEQRRPLAIVIGSMKSGTSALSIYLYRHPSVVRPNKKEMHFFDFQYQHLLASNDGIHRRETRAQYKRAFGITLGGATFTSLESSNHLVAIDDSPRYMFWSDRVPARILCTAPWAKLLAILRNPIDRAFSHYNMKRTSKGAATVLLQKHKRQKLPNFQEWVEMDIQLLKETGVVQDKIPLQDFAGSEQELEAWKDYTRRGKHAPVGRGLYAIQLRHWFKAYEEAGKSRSDFMIIQSERMKADKVGTYQKVLKFLGLEPHELEEYREPNSREYVTEMSNETRRMLQNFYEPHNQELYRLLGKEWDGAWDP